MDKALNFLIAFTLGMALMFAVSFVDIKKGVDTFRLLSKCEAKLHLPSQHCEITARVSDE